MTTEEREDRLEVAKVILQQLGGGRGFLLMTGARNLLAGSIFLAFQLPRSTCGITKVQVTLMPNDTYKMEFWENPDFRRPASLNPVKVYEDVYSEDLQRLFTEATGLDTRAPLFGRPR